MSEANAPVRLLYRHVPLAEPPAVSAVADGVFVALATPPPVRTVLRLAHEDGSVRALQVTRVVEVDGSDERGERGFYARFVEGDVLATSDRVGSEHLSSPDGSGPPGDQRQSTDEEDPSDAGHVAMAMPAPVVVDEDDDDEHDERSDAASSEGEGSDPDGAEGTEESEAEDASGSRRGRARKRRAKKPRK